MPGGAVVLVVAGFVVIVVGGSLAWIGVSRRFEKQIHVPEGAAGTAVEALGVVGYLARGLAVAVVGVLFVVAAFAADASRASGLDGALRAFAGLPFGQVVLIAIGVGWIASGAYNVVRAWRARMS